MELLFEFLTREVKLSPRFVAETMWRDYQRGGRQDKPVFLREFLSDAEPMTTRSRPTSLKRQARHIL